MQVWHKHEISLHIDIRWKQKSVLSSQVLSVHPEPLQTLVSPVSHNKFRSSVAIIEPLTMRSCKLAIRLSFASYRTDKIIILVILKNPEASISIPQIVTSVGTEAGISRSKVNCFSEFVADLVYGITTFIPDNLTV